MSLCSLDDINVHLPQDKLQVLNADDDAPQLDAERIIKGTLSDTFSPAELASWSTPATTPEMIRAIAGRFVAALVYARAFSSELAEVPEWAQRLYDDAMNMLNGIVAGTITLPEVSETPNTGGKLTSDDFYPNDDTPGPFFTMTKAF